MSEQLQVNDESLVLSETKKGWQYNRSRSTQVDLLAAALTKQYEGAQGCVVVPSGMSAISTVLHCVLRQHPNANLLYGNELYSDTPDLIQHVFRWMHVQNKEPPLLAAVDVVNEKQLLEVFGSKSCQGKVNVLFIESCSNPNGNMLNPELLPRLHALSQELIVIVDNTWLTHAVLNPFSGYAARYVVSSLTKYYSGGHAIAGAVLCSEKGDMDAIIDWVCVHGLHTSPHNADVILRHLAEVAARIARSSELTCHVARALHEMSSDYRNLVRVTHTSLATHPSYEVAKKCFATTNSSPDKDAHLHPSVLTFTVEAKSKTAVLNAMKYCAGLKLIDHKTSFGAQRSRTDPWPQKTSQGHFVCRLALGYEDTCDNVMKGLDVILKRLLV